MNKRSATKRSDTSSHFARRNWSRREFTQLAARGTASGVALSVLSAISGHAQTSAAAIRVAFITPFACPAVNQPVPMLDAFQAGLRALGWAESDTFIVEARFAAGQFQKIPEYVTELARLDVKAIYVLGSQAAALVKQETTIPVVMIGDPIGAQLAANSDRPGGTVTGLASVSQEICGKRLKLLKDVAPDLTRVAFAANPEHPATPNVLRMTRAAAEMLRIDLIPVDVRSEKDMEDAFDMMAKARTTAFIFYPVPMSDDRFRQLAELAVQRRLLWSDEIPRNVTLGALLSYGPDYPELSRRAAGYIDKILKGARPADLPIGVPTRFELVVNLKTAQDLGRTIPESVLSEATKVLR
jgi:putative tryptophan/tyrosine transport system substrate-binding protein